MLRILTLTTFLATPAFAQMQMPDTDNTQMKSGQMNHSMQSGMTMGDGQTAQMHGGSMDASGGGSMGMGNAGNMMAMSGMQEMMQGMMKMMGAMQGGNMPGHAGKAGKMTDTANQGVGGSPLSEPGQSGFAAIAEVVATLEADPNTDWASVDIDALREHLRDMDLVTVWSNATTEPVDGGLRFVVTGNSDVAPSIERMILGHASVMDGVDGWGYSSDVVDGGAAITVTVPDADLARLEGLGFYGLLASGMHHQPHHWMMATGNGMGMQ